MLNYEIVIFLNLIQINRSPSWSIFFRDNISEFLLKVPRVFGDNMGILLKDFSHEVLSLVHMKLSRVNQISSFKLDPFVGDGDWNFFEFSIRLLLLLDRLVSFLLLRMIVGYNGLSMLVYDNLTILYDELVMNWDRVVIGLGLLVRFIGVSLNKCLM